MSPRAREVWTGLPKGLAAGRALNATGPRTPKTSHAIVPIPLVESALLPSAIAGSCDLRTVVNLVFLKHLPFIALF